MVLTSALGLALALVASSGGERTLLCRPRVTGDASLARAEALVGAGKSLESRVLDYGVACESPAEGARAARRAGLRHAVSVTAEGRSEGSTYVFVLADAESERERARRSLEVKPGVDPLPRVQLALEDLMKALPPPPGPRPAHVAAWTVVGAGVAAMAAGVAFTAQAGRAADRANRASDPGAFGQEKRDFEAKRRSAGIAYGAGGAAIAAGLVWRFAF